MSQIVEWMNVNQGVSGWIQAIGSLLTLWAAIAIPMWQRATAQRDAVATGGPLCADAARAIGSTFANLRKSQEFSGIDVGRLKKAVSDLADFAAQTLPPRAIGPFIALRRSVLRFQEAVNEGQRGLEGPSGSFDEFKRTVIEGALGLSAAAVLGHLKRLAETAPRMNLTEHAEALRKTLSGEDS